jgi:hypothetical protein
LTTASHRPAVVFATMGAGQVTVGGWVSLTVTVKLHEPVLFEESVAVQLTVVVPFWKAEPGAGLHVTDTVSSQLSVAVGGV